MKKINFVSLVFFVLFLNGTRAQEGFIINNDGKKIIVDGSKVKLFPTYDILEYQIPGSEEKNKISLYDVTAATFENFRIETFSIEEKPRAYFVLAELPEKKLIGYNAIFTYVVDNMGRHLADQTISLKSRTIKVTKYTYYIIDASNKLIEKLEFNDFYRDKDGEKRNDAEVILKKHFSGCPELMTRLKKFETGTMNFENASRRAQKTIEKYDKGNAKIFEFFNNPEYSKCNQSISQPVSAISKNDNQTESAVSKTANYQYDGMYNFESMTVQYHGSIRDMPIKGAYIIKDGFVEIKSKDNSPKYKIKYIKDSVIYCEDKKMIHTVELKSETGKKKSSNYDTKIIFTADKALGGSVAEYWCIKQ